jgi:hypothetical protein
MNFLYLTPERRRSGRLESRLRLVAAVEDATPAAIASGSRHRLVAGRQNGPTFARSPRIPDDEPATGTPH